MSEDVDEILRMAVEVRPDIVHVSSEMDAVNFDMMRELRSKLDKDIQLMKAISVENEDGIKAAQKYAKTSDLLLLDTKVKGFPGVGAPAQRMTGISAEGSLNLLGSRLFSPAIVC